MDKTHKLDFLDTLSAFIKERTRQIEKHGPGLDRPDGHASPEFVPLLQLVEKMVSIHTEAGAESWLEVMCEEFLEVITERDPVKLEREVIQLGTVCAAWATAIRRRRAAGAGMPTATEQAEAVEERTVSRKLTGSPGKKLKKLPSPYSEAE